jgi:hypothetical protein
MNVIALAFAKLSLVLLFKRIAPTRTKPFTSQCMRLMVAAYVLICIFAIAFQCQLPQPWIVSRDRCSTHGVVYYATTTLNMTTDAFLALWIFPTIWLLNMETHTKLVVLSLFGSRLIVCLVDVGRMLVIQKALQSEDQTSKALFYDHPTRLQLYGRVFTQLTAR